MPVASRLKEIDMHAAILMWRSLALAAILSASACTGAPEPVGGGSMTARRPLVIAHRGASALLPEHTLAAYQKAIEDGADFIEPDLVMTRDGVLVARHDNVLGSTTDVAAHAAFASRRTTRTIDGETATDWFVEDFSLAEIRLLHARERLPEMRGTAHDGVHGVPTFAEIVALVERETQARGRTIGLIPEIKHSSHHHARGLDPERALVAAIGEHAVLRRVPLGIQSFEVGNLRRLHDLLGDHANVFLVQLVGAPDDAPADRVLAVEHAHTYASMLTPEGLRAITAYARVIAPSSRAVLPLDDDGALASPSRLIGDAHAAGLEVHVWTLRPENRFLPPALRCAADPDARCESGAIAEAKAFAAAGVDAVFADDPGLALRAFGEAYR
jgi:glycerophosphoryl diester phosphodiesterase